MSEKRELRPCPIDGGDAVRRELLFGSGGIYKYSVGCKTCLLEYGRCKTQIEADEMWNQRVQVEIREKNLRDIIVNSDLYRFNKDDVSCEELVKEILANTRPPSSAKEEAASLCALDEEAVRLMISEYTGFDSVKDKLAKAIVRKFGAPEVKWPEENVDEFLSPVGYIPTDYATGWNQCLKACLAAFTEAQKGKP